MPAHVLAAQCTCRAGKQFKEDMHVSTGTAMRRFVFSQNPYQQSMF